MESDSVEDSSFKASGHVDEDYTETEGKRLRGREDIGR
jgi:hypothetical protein